MYLKTCSYVGLDFSNICCIALHYRITEVEVGLNRLYAQISLSDFDLTVQQNQVKCNMRLRISPSVSNTAAASKPYIHG